MARPAVVDIDLGYNALLSAIEELQKNTLLVGIQETARTQGQFKGNRHQRPGRSIAEYAADNEFGTSQIPQRSFIRSTFDRNLNRIENIVTNQITLAATGQSTVTQSLNVIGSIVSSMIQLRIREIQTPPNSRRTIAIKGSNKPLIDFGQMLRSITFMTRRNP